MTKEEAIKYLIEHSNPGYPDSDGSKWDEAINMAISALSETHEETHGVCLDDMIKRTDAIDAIRAFYDEYIVYDNGKSIEDLISGLPPVQQWIPVTERLPKPVAELQKREWFITSNQYGGVTITCYEFESSPFKEGWQTDMTILAWMPLPEPWKGGLEE